MMCIFVSFATHVTQQPMERLYAEREKGQWFTCWSRAFPPPIALSHSQCHASLIMLTLHVVSFIFSQSVWAWICVKLRFQYLD